jgi:hypothetical protein
MRFCRFLVVFVAIASSRADTVSSDYLRKIFASVTIEVKVQELPAAVMAELGAVAHDPSYG